jgi:hypothetical protein
VRLEEKLMANWTTNCKGTIKTKKGEKRCPEEVTYVPGITTAGEDIAEFDAKIKMLVTQ